MKKVCIDKDRTSKEMLQNAVNALEDARDTLRVAQDHQKECTEKVAAFKLQQTQLLSRLAGAGVKRGRDDDALCCVCKSNDKTSLLIPCGHKCLCEQCAKRFHRGARCPLCRAAVQSVQRVYE